MIVRCRDVNYQGSLNLSTHYWSYHPIMMSHYAVNIIFFHNYHNANYIVADNVVNL